MYRCMKKTGKFTVWLSVGAALLSSCNSGGGSEPTPVVPLPVSQVKHIFLAADGKVYKISNLGNPVPDTVTLYEGAPGKVNVVWDRTNDKIYCRNINTQEIFSVKTDGSGYKKLIDAAGVNNALALDAPAGKIYWSENEIIKRANSDGTNAEEFQVFPNASFIEALAVDTLNKRLYWCDIGTQKIGSLKTDKTDLKNSLVTGVTTYAITASPSEGKLYWSEQQLGVKSSGLEGGIPSVVYGNADALAFSQYDPTGKEVFVLVGGNKIYKVGASDSQVHAAYTYEGLNMYGMALSY